MEPKRLYRSLTDRKIAGVAAGLAEYFIMDPLLVRLAFVILTFAGGGGILIYIVLWIVTPENPIRVQPVMSQPAQEYQQADPAGSDSSSNAPGFSPDGSHSETSNPTSPVPQTKERNKGSLIGGLVLITLGLLFLADELIPEVNFGDLWPVILIVIGAALLLKAVSKRNADTNQL